MSLLQPQLSIKEEISDNEDLSLHKKWICRLCGFSFSEEKFLRNHLNLCKDINNPEDRLGVEPTAVKKEEFDSTELADEQVTSEFTLNIKHEKVETTELTVTVHGRSIDAPKVETLEEVFPYSKYGNAIAQSTHLKERLEVCKPVKLNKCTVCDYSSTNRNHFTRHMRNHSLEKPFKCILCDYSTIYKNRIIRHIRTHTGEKPFKCDSCDYASAQRGALTQHMRRHSGEKPFKCTLCDFACGENSALTKHMKTHSGEKPFKCTICDFATAYHSYLTDHIRTHSGEKPFRCALCDYTFAKSRYLTQHMRNHAVEKPFKCTLCDYSCLLRRTIRSHMKKHT